MSTHQSAEDRYEIIADGWFRPCGRWGLRLPAISLGCWFNFGAAGSDTYKQQDEAKFHENARQILLVAFDLGITHFDVANVYRPPQGAAEDRVGRIIAELPRRHQGRQPDVAGALWHGGLAQAPARQSRRFPQETAA